MIKDTKRRRIKLSTLIFLSLIASISISLFALAYGSNAIFKNTFIEEIGKAQNKTLQQIIDRTKVVKNTAITVSNMVSSEGAIVAAIMDQTMGPEKEAATTGMLNDMYLQYSNIFDQIDISFNIMIISGNGYIYNSNGNIEEGEKIRRTYWYKKVIENRADMFWIGGIDDPQGDNGNRYVITFVKNFIRGEKQTPYATLLVSIDEGYLAKAYEPVISEYNNIYIVDEKGTIMSHPDKEMVGINFLSMENLFDRFEGQNYTIIEKSGKQILLSYCTDPETNWTIVQETLLMSLFAPLQRVTLLIIFIALATLFIMFVYASCISKMTARPLKELRSLMNKVEQGDFHVTFNSSGWNEIERLGENFNNMVSQIKNLIENIKQTESLKTKAELDFLQAQINPHFIYNTLFSIKCIVHMGDHERAEKMLGIFLEYLKRTLSESKELITLEDEVDGIMQYVFLQQYKNNNGIDLRIDMDGHSRHCCVPKLLLQPLVENSIIHGIEPTQKQGMIRITSRTKENVLLIRVEDNGVGIPQDLLQDLLDKPGTGQKTTRIGVLNVKERLTKYFGEQCSFRIESHIGKGTVIELSIPIIQ